MLNQRALGRTGDLGALETFALEGLTLPAFNIAMGAWLILVAPHRQNPTAEELASAHPFVRYLASLPRIERRVGAFMIFVGFLIGGLRLAS